MFFEEKTFYQMEVLTKVNFRTEISLKEEVEATVNQSDSSEITEIYMAR